MRGIVYCIECNITGEKYYGSTIYVCEDRLARHIHGIKSYENGTAVGVCASNRIIKRGDYKMNTVKEVSYEDESELLWEERHAIEADPKSINIKKPILTDEERQELNTMCKRRYAKNFYHANKDFCLAKNRAYRQTETGKASKAKSDKKYREGEHREELLAKKREYHHKNKEIIAEKNKAYREGEKREEILAKKRADYIKAKASGLCDKIECPCGGTYTLKSKARHFKTAKHINYIHSN